MQLLNLNLKIAEREQNGEPVQSPNLPGWFENKEKLISNDCVRFEGWNFCKNNKVAVLSNGIMGLLNFWWKIFIYKRKIHTFLQIIRLWTKILSWYRPVLSQLVFDSSCSALLPLALFGIMAVTSGFSVVTPILGIASTNLVLPDEPLTPNFALCEKIRSIVRRRCTWP